MFIIDDIIASIIDIGVNIFKDMLNDKKDQKKLFAKITDFVSSEFNSTFLNLNFDNEIHYGSLSDFLIKSAWKEISDYILNIDIELSEKFLKSIITKARYYAKANNKQKEKIVDRFVNEALRILKFFYTEKLVKTDRLIIKQTSENVNFIVNSATEIILENDKKNADEIIKAIKNENSSKTIKLTELKYYNWPYIRNSFFTGRTIQIETLRMVFKKESMNSIIQNISGMGGVGKTQIALEYAYRYVEDYKYILWVNADTFQNVMNSYTAFINSLEPQYSQITDTNVIRNLMYNWFNTHTNWLLIFDNADDLSILYELLPNNKDGHIIITTRDINCKLGFPIDIDIFSEKEAIDYLYGKTKILDVIGSKRLAHLLDKLPLALEQAASYIDINKIDYSEYISLYSEYKLELIEEIDTVHTYHSTVAKTWNISIKKLKIKVLISFYLYLHY